jgi:hypothetical protein
MPSGAHTHELGERAGMGETFDSDVKREIGFKTIQAKKSAWGL